jgi:hypothetical protein
MFLLISFGRQLALIGVAVHKNRNVTFLPEIIALNVQDIFTRKINVTNVFLVPQEINFSALQIHLRDSLGL